jgi:hypothetical protein
MAEGASQAEQPIIFISYRRVDSGWAADLLTGSLQRTFGVPRVFCDVRGIDAGDDFEADLEEQLQRASVILVLIGGGWLRVQDEYGRRRLDRNNDWVRREIRDGLERRRRVIPVLIDDADMPDEPDALPADIAPLVRHQRLRLRQTNSDDDIEALSRELEKSGFHRVATPSSPGDSDEFTDRQILDVVASLRQIQRRQGIDFVGRRELLRELDGLFNRMTFRFETLRECSEQRWADRLDSAYQTAKALRMWERNVREVAEDAHSSYVKLLKEVGSYAMQMGALLFDPPVDFNRIEDHIGRPTFKEQLPPAIRFPSAADRKPVISDPINDAIEPHRKRAVSLMNRLAKAQRQA